VLARYARNLRLADAICFWAFAQAKRATERAIKDPKKREAAAVGKAT
jgi:hypothetical protein